ncbi:rho GTPase-activating 27 isoform X6 [Chlorella sorokiniana]|uniref:Rho GTPase-activating 27 isoform X6 n=1 Tax=Chlorella sorokiniana TaxID=3076 RepID=A0A2P6TZ75_CHLSO|nr:rho GTPase-activating 27 isoform X6 [Chlorella sorokiniana]|eukprot:PRW59368.1 rho GTPase-activating 27 isoform X6 [Chlorella sorokiniana]
MAESGPEPPHSGSQPDPEVQHLEQLTDQIQADAEDQQTAEDGGAAAAAAAAVQQPPVFEPSEQQPAAARATAPAHDGGQLVHQCWEEAVDLNSGHRYWFNRATGVSQWHPPAGWAAAAPGSAPTPAAGEAGAAQPPTTQQQQPQQPPASPAYTPGYYYRDVAGQVQGPFTLEQLRGWRGSLPMDLPVLQLTEPQPEKQAASGAASPPAGQAGGQGEERQASSRWVQLELARLLGDNELLERWRLEHPEQAVWPGSAPPAEWYELERQRGTAHSLADAVLCGLPVYDETVAVARVAAASGKSLQEVLEWNRQVDYTATAYRVAARGRIQAPGGPESLYSDLASYANPWEVEQQLAAVAERRKRGLSGAELRAVRERKKELKRQKQVAWLLS